MESVLMPNEIELFVDTMAPQAMINIGTSQWLEWHHRLQKLNQQAAVEAASLKEEHVKETLVSFGKAAVLVHEAILINIWKHKILPKLLKLEPNPECTFIAYSILYHEGVSVSLLELVMFHSSCCEALGEASIDLLDYASGIISQLLSLQHQKKPPDHKETAEHELTRQRDTLAFEVGVRCLTILRYLVENMQGLPISVCSRLYTTYDIPVLLTEILGVKPWVKNNKLYVAGKWKEWDQEQLGQAEAQVWLTLRYLLLDPDCPKYYPITENRRNQLVRLLPLISPTLLDQLAPLIELKHWLCRMSCIREYATSSKPFLLEAVLEIKEGIMQQCQGKWKKIAEKQRNDVFAQDKNTLKEAAVKLNEAYNTDLLEKFDDETTQQEKCAQCGNSAIQRCSQCKGAWYCSRACQVNHWPQHKPLCQN